GSPLKPTPQLCGLPPGAARLRPTNNCIYAGAPLPHHPAAIVIAKIADVCADSVSTSSTPSDVPDVLAPDLRVIFCGINPGRVSAAAHAHFANPRNDFWRLLRDAGFTPRLLAPDEQFALLDYGVGVTNAAARTTPGSGDLRKADFAGAADRLEHLAADLKPRWIGFV